MAKSKQHARTSSTSAAQRRAQTREQRHESDQKVQSRRARSRSNQQRKANRRLWLIISGVIVALVAVIAIFIVIAQQNSNTPTTDRSPSDPAVLSQVTHVGATIFSQVGTGGVTSNVQAVHGSPAPLTGPNGKPEIFYNGAEYCPLCAAERWSMVVALSRFGTFTQLPLTHSSGSDSYPNTATFSFYQSQYSSDTIDFVPLEQFTNQSNGANFYTTLQTPTTEQKQLITTYDAPPYVDQSGAGGFPFIDIGNRYLVTGATYAPDVLANMDQKGIASHLSDPGSDVTKKIVGTANYLTAAICAITQNQPASVCTTAPIPQIEQSLPHTTAYSTSGSLVEMVGFSQDMILPRRD